VKVLGSNGSGLYSDIADGIRYAANHDADVINLSLGGSYDSDVLRDAVNYATAKGALVVAAAGNDGSAVEHYPAAIGNVLAIGASTRTGGRYSWSNYGANWVDLAAPGCNPAQDEKGVLVDFCGTSSATPLVSGVAALLASMSPQPTVGQLRTALMSSASPLAGNWVARGSGRVAAGAAVTRLTALLDRTGPVTAMRTPAARSVVRGTITVGAVASDPAGVSKVQLVVGGKVVASDATAPYTLRWATGSSRNQVVTLNLRSYDRFGNIGRAARSVTVRN
jgi:subtilisin family serine protease